MADIKKLIDRKTGRTIYPQTIAKAIYDSYGKNLQTRLDELNQNYVATSTQTLTDEQKAQARTNINAAPGGFGLGECATIPEGRSANNITASGFYYCDKDTPNSNDWMILHIQRDTGHAVQFGRTYNQDSGWPMVTRVRNTSISDAWQPWEWLTPPMDLGVEYRTTERYLGKPLYKKLIEFPSLTGRDYQYINSRVCFAISAIGEVRSPQDTNFWMPMVVNPVAQEDTTPFPTIAFTNFYSANIGVVCASTSPYIGQPAHVLVTYYKTTD